MFRNFIKDILSPKLFGGNKLILDVYSAIKIDPQYNLQT